MTFQRRGSQEEPKGSVTDGTDQQGSREEEEGSSPAGGGAAVNSSALAHSHSFEVRRKAVQLCLEEGFPVEQVAREMGVGHSTLGKWLRVCAPRGKRACSRSRPVRTISGRKWPRR